MELVPEESEFRYGEVIEVSSDQVEWNKKIFLEKLTFDTYNKYLTVPFGDDEKFFKWEKVNFNSWRYARKIKERKKNNRRGPDKRAEEEDILQQKE